jgi:C1A family cysteine protease
MYRNYEKGSIYFNDHYKKAYLVYGLIYKKWIAKGGASGFLGLPTTDESDTKDKKGRYNNFEGGSIYWTSSTGAFEIHGDIRIKWLSLGGETSFLGYPLTDETATPDSIGRFNHFQGGSIYWTPLTGAYEVHGLIRSKWASVGWEKSNLGYPVSDELKCSDGIGRYTKFQGGTIYYHPTYGTHPVYENIYLKWADNGKESGKYGYPTGDPIKYNAAVNVSVKETSATNTYNLDSKSFKQYFSKGIIYDNSSTAKKVDLRPEISRRDIKIDNQGNRGTCSVFAMTFLLEYSYTGYTSRPGFNNLSQEYLNHMANKATNKTDDGDFFSSIEKGYNKYGIIPDSMWTYNPNATYNYNTFDQKLTQNMLNFGYWTTAKGNKLSGKFLKGFGTPVGLTNTEFNNILSYLYKGIPVAIGRNHSMVIVGYTVDSTKSGGGEFIFRNSYGINDGDKGYRYESFKSVRDSVNDAYVYYSLKDLPHIGER